VISAQNLGFKRDGNIILDDVSFSIEKGEYIGLIGPNGAGKSSLIKLILGFHKPTSGSLNIASQTKIGYVPQSYTLSPVVPISVAEVLMMSGIKDRKQLPKQLEQVGLESDFLSKNFHQLSGGQQQRVIIARALCSDPDLLIIDEPLNGVDYKTKLAIYELLLELNTANKLTILFVSHEVDHIMKHCHHILCLNRTQYWTMYLKLFPCIIITTMIIRANSMITTTVTITNRINKS